LRELRGRAADRVGCEAHLADDLIQLRVHAFQRLQQQAELIAPRVVNRIADVAVGNSAGDGNRVREPDRNRADQQECEQARHAQADDDREDRQIATEGVLTCGCRERLLRSLVEMRHRRIHCAIQHVECRIDSFHDGIGSRFGIIRIERCVDLIDRALQSGVGIRHRARKTLTLTALLRLFE
jgi:hypothetical protein